MASKITNKALSQLPASLVPTIRALAEQYTCTVFEVVYIYKSVMPKMDANQVDKFVNDAGMIDVYLHKNTNYAMTVFIWR